MQRTLDGIYMLEHWRECRELRREIELDGINYDPDSTIGQFLSMVANAEGLRVLFGGACDHTAVEEAHRLVAVIRAAAAAELGANHPGTVTRH